MKAAVYTVYKFYVIDTIQSKNLDVSLILEPIPRGTTAAIYFSALICDKDEEMLIMPSDHLISNNSLFSREVRKTANEKSDDKWITFGTKPNFPSTGYGYIKGVNVESTKNKNLLKGSAKMNLSHVFKLSSLSSP